MKKSLYIFTVAILLMVNSMNVHADGGVKVYKNGDYTILNVDDIDSLVFVQNDDGNGISSCIFCKDDIANLQSQINKKATLEQIAALQSELNSASVNMATVQAILQAQIDSKASVSDLSATRSEFQATIVKMMDAVDVAVADAAKAATDAKAYADKAVSASSQIAAIVESKADKAELVAAINAMEAIMESMSSSINNNIISVENKAAQAQASAEKAINIAQSTEEKLAAFAVELRAQLAAILTGFVTKEELEAHNAELVRISETYATIATVNALADKIMQLQEMISKLTDAATTKVVQ